MSAATSHLLVHLRRYLHPFGLGANKQYAVPVFGFHKRAEEPDLLTRTKKKENMTQNLLDTQTMTNTCFISFSPTLPSLLPSSPSPKN